MKGQYFSLDAMFAFLILTAAVLVFTLSLSTPSHQEYTTQTLASNADDLLNVMAKQKMGDLSHDPVVAQYFSNGVLTEEDRNKSMIDVLAALWATNQTSYVQAAENLSYHVLSGIATQGTGWALYVDGDLLYNNSAVNGSSIAVSRRFASGFAKGLPTSGCLARAYLNEIKGKQAYAYSFFGGFIGQGNLSRLMDPLPVFSTPRGVYLEFSSGANFSFYMNSVFCGWFNSSYNGSGITVSSVTFTSPACLNAISSSSDNRIDFNFSNVPLERAFLGGGFVRIDYETNETQAPISSTLTHQFPGVHGVISEYDSIYIPGNLTSISGRLAFENNYTTFLYVGNRSIFTTNGSASVQNFTLSDANFTALNYSQLSQTTIPMLLGSYAGVGGVGTADVVLITDTSGSMNWRMDQDNQAGTVRNCTDASLYADSTQRLSVAKCVDKNFISIVLGSRGNRVALVAFSSSVGNYTALLGQGNETYLNATVEAYAQGGGTCISCAINKAYEILSQQSNATRQKYVVVMSDGVPTYRSSTTFCGNQYAVDASGFASGEDHASESGTHWARLYTPTTETLYGVSSLNDSFARAVSSAGNIYAWNGTNWSLSASPTSNALYAIDLYNATFGLAVGEGGEVYRWNGATWSSMSGTGTNDFFGVKIWNSTLAFAVGASGKIYRWNGASWAQSTDTGSNTLYAVDVVNNTFAFAAGSSGLIYRWTGAAWVSFQDTGSDTHYGLDIVNTTYAFSVSSGEDIYRWTGGTSFSSIFDPALGFAFDFRDVQFINNTFAIAVGDMNGRVAHWNGTWVVKEIPYAWMGNSTVGLDCNDDDSCSLTTSIPQLNVNYSACILGAMPNMTMHSIGFGPVGSCGLGNATMYSIAACGNGSYFASTNASYLAEIYETLAENITVASNETQISNVSAGVHMYLSPESYLRFTYTANDTLLFRAVSIQREEGPFPACNGTFAIQPDAVVKDLRASSYSGEYWTNNVSVKKGSGPWATAFNLSGFAPNFTLLGDPFIVQFSPTFVTGGNNSISIKTAASLGQPNAACSANNKLFYTATYSVFVPYGTIGSSCTGANVTVYYDSNLDGVSDGSSQLAVSPAANGTPITVQAYNATAPQNAVADALLRLLDQLNFDNRGSQYPGSQANPVDIALGSNVQIDVVSAGDVPFIYGPLEVRMVTWVK